MGATTTTRKLLHIALMLTVCSGIALACRGKLLVSGITAEEKRIILAEHNRLRQIVATGRYPGQPSAENMREIIWDDELAARAQQWADNCEFRHDPHRTINRFTMGQNLAVIWSTVPLDADDGDFPSRIQSWFNEVQKYSFGDAWSPKTGHYSQLVWGETSLVGCGYSEYKDTSKYNKLYVCNYGPGGNVVGYNPYEVGKPACGTYGMRPSSRYQGLCAAPGATSTALISNTIETYEYKSSNAYNSKQSAYSTKFTQPATSLSPSPAAKSIIAYPQQASSVPKGAPAAPATSRAGAGATAFGRAAAAYTTETGQYKFRNKLEAYKPSAAEFQKSVLKHTILSTHHSSHQSSQYQSQTAYKTRPQQTQTQAQTQIQPQDPEVYVVEEPEPAPYSTTDTPAKRGWSLLTWRG